MFKRLSSGFIRRVKLKVSSVAPLIIGAIAVLMMMMAIIYFMKPYFPQGINKFIYLLSGGDWQSNKNSLKNIFDSYGVYSQPLFILIQLLQVLLAPIPGQFTGLLGGYLFGLWQGLFLTMLGLLIGSSIAILTSRLFGKIFVRKIIPQPVISKFDYLVEKGGYSNFFMIFLLPALPDDAICFIAGMTKLNIWLLIFVCLVGRLPGMAVLTYAGANITADLEMAKTIFAIAMIVSVAIWLYDEELKAYFYRMSKGTQI